MLSIGFAKVDITPARQWQTIYHLTGDPPGDANQVVDRLFARALALRGTEHSAVWVTADVLAIDSAMRERVTTQLGGHGVSAEQVILGATHTHTAPTITPFNGREPTPENYLAFLADQLTQVALEAFRQMKPATVSYGEASVDLSVNRRQIGRISQVNALSAPAGQVDPIVRFLHFRCTDDRVALLFNYAAHPLCMSKNVPLISADFPGCAASLLEEQPPVTHAQFLQGSCADINVKLHGTQRETRQVGQTLAAAVHKGLGSMRGCKDDIIQVSTQPVRLLHEGIPTWSEAKAYLENTRISPGRHPKDLRRSDWARRMCHIYETKGGPSREKWVTIQALRIGPVLIIALPGEIFVGTAEAMRQRIDHAELIVVGFCNHCEVGYIPPPQAMEQGGYEVEEAPYYYGLAPWSRHAEPAMIDAACNAIESLQCVR